jgi:L-lysine exporter family protein LysE/ArgO
MNIAIFLLISYVIGFFTAMPIGATQVEIAKRSIPGYTKEAFMVVLGSVLSDTMYGFIAMFGIAPFLKDEHVEAFFWFIGGLILLLLGVFTIIYSETNADNKEKPMLFKSHTSFLVGFSLAVTNPPIIFWWIFCFEFLKSANIVPYFSYPYASLFIVFGAIGIASYLSGLTLFLKKVGKNISYGVECKINKVMGTLLILLSFYFLFKSADVFLKLKGVF